MAWPQRIYNLDFGDQVDAKNFIQFRAHDIMLSSSFVWCMIDQIRVTFNNCYMIIGLRVDGQEKNVANDIQQLEDYCNAPWIIPDM